MLTVVTFLWSTPGYRSKFTPEHVRTLKNMVARHYPDPHRFLCITEQPVHGVQCHPRCNDHSTVPTPTCQDGPSCYRRLNCLTPGSRPSSGDASAFLDLMLSSFATFHRCWIPPSPALHTATPDFGVQLMARCCWAAPHGISNLWTCSTRW